MPLPTLNPPPKIALLALGGTIASRVSREGGGATLTLSAADLAALLPGVESVARVDARTVRAAMSADLLLEDIVDLARLIEDLDTDGVVVAQGTDTIEETAFLLDCLCSPVRPVVVTGAMRNPGKPGDDGPANLLAALRVAASPLAKGAGVLVVSDDAIHLARQARKTHSFATHAFASALGPVGFVVEDRVRLPLLPRTPLPRFASPEGALPPVALLTLSLGNDERLIGAVAETGYRGLVVEAFGAGHAAALVVPALERLACTMPVVFTSRTGAGELYRRTGSYPGSEGDLLARGLLSAVGLDGVKARILLALLIDSGASRETMVQAFENASV